MKIKIALLGLFFANSIIDPIYADQYGFPLEPDEVDGPSMVEEKDDLETQEAKQDAEESENLIKVGATVMMSPAIVYQDELFSPKNSLKAKLTFKADVPQAWCNKEAKVAVVAGWDGKNFTIKNAAVTIDKRVTIGYTSSIFGYEKADASLLISPGADVLQMKYEYAADWLRFGYAIERPVALKLGLFDKSKLASEETGDKEEKDPTNKVDEDKKGPFEIKNRLPAIGLNIGVVTDRLNIALSGLGRCTDYIHRSNAKEKNAESNWFLSGGGHLGIQYQVVPKKFTVTGQGAYVHGLGDYLSGLAAIQAEEGRKEMCAVYYLDKDKVDLAYIKAFGFGGTLAYAATPKWKFSVGGSWLTTLEDSDKPAHTFRAQWNVVPNISYEVNKYFTFSGGYSLQKELRQDETKDKGMEHKFSGSIKFSLK